jgi:hypothetical protein
MAPSNAQDDSGTNLGHATSSFVGMIYYFIKFIFTAIFCVITFFVCGLCKLCCKKEEEEEEEDVETGKKKQTIHKASGSRKKTGSKKKTGP